MATKKVTPKKEVKIEDIAAKTVDDITADLVKTQNQLRGALASVGDALIMKREQLSDIVQAIEAKQEELNELADKEKVIKAMQDLKEEFEDAKREYERKAAQLEVTFEDKHAELMRNFTKRRSAEEQRLEDEVRQRTIEREDETRKSKLENEETELAFSKWKDELDKREAELGNFDERVKDEVDRLVKGERVRMNFESQSLRKDTEASIKILEAQVAQLKLQNQDLAERLVRAEQDAKSAAERANEVVIQSLEAGAGKKALEEVRAIAQRQAESGRK